MRVSEGRERVHQQWHFLVVVPQPVSFYIWKKQANRCGRFIFPCLIHHFLARLFLVKCSLHSSVHSLQSCQSRRLTKTGPLTNSRKIQKLIRQTFREEHRRNIHVKSSLVVHHNTVRQSMLCLILFHSCWHVWHGGWLFWSLICYQNLCIMLRILLLPLKLVFITLKSSWGLAALSIHVINFLHPSILATSNCKPCSGSVWCHEI